MVSLATKSPKHLFSQSLQSRHAHFCRRIVCGYSGFIVTPASSIVTLSSTNAITVKGWQLALMTNSLITNIFLLSIMPCFSPRIVLHVPPLRRNKVIPNIWVSLEWLSCTEDHHAIYFCLALYFHSMKV